MAEMTVRYCVCCGVRTDWREECGTCVEMGCFDDER